MEQKRRELIQLLQDTEYTMSAYEYLGGLSLYNQDVNEDAEDDLDEIMKEYYKQLMLRAYAITELAALDNMNIDLNNLNKFFEEVGVNLNQYKIKEIEAQELSKDYMNVKISSNYLNQNGYLNKFMIEIRDNEDRIHNEIFNELQ